MPDERRVRFDLLSAEPAGDISFSLPLFSFRILSLSSFGVLQLPMDSVAYLRTFHCKSRRDRLLPMRHRVLIFLYTSLLLVVLVFLVVCDD